MAKQSEVFVFDEQTKNMWWVLVLTGVLSVIFGFVAIIWPSITIGVLALLLAVYIGIYGVVDIVSGIKKFSSGFLPAALTTVVGLLYTVYKSQVLQKSRDVSLGFSGRLYFLY